MSYYLSKCSARIEKPESLNNMPKIFQNPINAINMYDSYSIMSYCTPILSVENTLKMIHHGVLLWDYLISEYYNEKNDAVVLLFQQYIACDVDNIYHPSTVI